MKSDVRGRNGPGGLRGLQNRRETPQAAPVGSIPTRSRQLCYSRVATSNTGTPSSSRSQRIVPIQGGQSQTASLARGPVVKNGSNARLRVGATS